MTNQNMIMTWSLHRPSNMKMHIREAVDSDLIDVLSIERAAFGSDEEATLVENLLGDQSAQPILSLLAFQDNQAVGHILFTKAHLEPKAALSISLLAPLAVIPEFQRRGIGGKLLEHGLQALSATGVDLVFVLGHPQYYPRHGFKPAGQVGFDAPFPIPEKDADAWMVKALRPGKIGSFSGTVICADMINKPEYWHE